MRMKKYVRQLVLISIVLLMGIIVFNAKFSENKTWKANSARTGELKAVEKTCNGITVSIDPRMELLASLELISNYDQKFGLITKQDFSYKTSATEYFSKFSNHEAVNLFETIAQHGFSYDAHPTSMLYLTNPVNMNKQIEFDKDIIKRAGGDTKLELFIKYLNKYASDTRFIEFFYKNLNFYKTVIETACKTISKGNYVGDIENYYGMKNHSYNIILSPLFHSGGFGPRLARQDGSYDIYSIQGPQSVENDIPLFGNDTSFRYLVWHEFGHSFVNNLTTENLSQVEKYKKLYDPISKMMSKQAYDDWECCVNEHIVRAITTRLAYIKLGKRAGDEAMNYEKSCGFCYLEPLCNKLQQYEKNRGKYKSFKEFYPELITVFKELAE